MYRHAHFGVLRELVEVWATDSGKRFGRFITWEHNTSVNLPMSEVRIIV